MKLKTWAALLGVLSCLAAQGARGADRPFVEEDLDVKPWAEIQASLPDAPVAERLVEVKLAPTERYRLYVDPASLTVGSDAVVRYVAVVVSPSGARSVNFEGIRCATGERRLYAFGHSDGTWGQARGSEWKTIRRGVNRYESTLAEEFFCPEGVSVRTPEEAIGALRAGGHPDIRHVRGA